MTKLKDYMNDGANFQAQAVLCFIKDFDFDLGGAIVNVGRWENCREQGYVLSLVNKNYEQLNIAFFEHRNSDSIHAIKWIQSSTNSLNIDTAILKDIYKDKYNTSFSVEYGKIVEMADLIKKELASHLNAI